MSTSSTHRSTPAHAWNGRAFGIAALAVGATALGFLAYRAASSRRSQTTPFPRDEEIDGTLSLVREGYTFISNRCIRNGSDVFETRLALKPVICMQGEDAARMFYVPDRFTRRRAIPVTTLTLLQDWGSVQMLDGSAHRHRKRLFIDMLMDPDRVQALLNVVDQEWAAAVEERWRWTPSIVFHDEASELLCRAACRWTGVPLREHQVAQRTLEFVSMIEGSGTIGPRNWRGQLLRLRTEHWIRGVISAIRRGTLSVPPGCAAQKIAWHRDEAARLLPVRIAAVELINVLRPIVAVARFLTFAAVALEEHPEARERLEDAGDEELAAFADEVRRLYPFFPAIGGRARVPFDWRGHHFSKGTWVLLDIYGTNHDPRSWEHPYTFKPERFRSRRENGYDFIPQGGGDHATSHRCPGEMITTSLIKAIVRHLLRLRYRVPPQDLSIDLARMPAIPASRFIMTGVEQRWT